MAHNTVSTLAAAAVGCLAGGVMLGISWSQPAIAQVTFDPPPGQDRPDQTAGGGSRGESACWANAADGDQFLSLSGNTVSSSHPTFEIQVPATRQQSSASALPEATRPAIASPAIAEFSLFDENGVLTYESDHSLPSEETIISIELPEEHPGLAADQHYFWIFAVVCDPNNRLMDASVSGMITRTDETATD